MIGACYHTTAQVQQAVNIWRTQGQKVALVPTMGGLHEGHLALVEAALASHDRVVTSLYVNPTQFAAHEDLDNYPRTMAADKAALARFGERVSLFAPQSLYGDDHATMITPQGAALPLEGVHRPHFFSGVATVVFKLFQAVPAHSAYFGEKDFQQLAVIRQMVRDFQLPITIESVPTVRAADGLALSSRNAYLSPEERANASQLYQQMKACAKAIAAGVAVQTACDAALKALKDAGFAKVDYFVFCDAHTLQVADKIEKTSRLLAAIWLGETRLIDNASYQELCIAQ